MSPRRPEDRVRRGPLAAAIGLLLVGAWSIAHLEDSGDGPTSIPGDAARSTTGSRRLPWPIRDPAAHWPSWRGPLGTGEAPRGDPPVTWDEDHNVRWKVPIPGKGHSTPVVWGDQIFLTSAIPSGPTTSTGSGPEGAHDNLMQVGPHRLVGMALDRGTGRLLWQEDLGRVTPHEAGHRTGSYASGSPVTDGEIVVFPFGSFGYHALDRKGHALWHRDLGDMATRHGHGEGSSPALVGDHVLINWDHEGPSFLMALDRRTGETLWTRERDPSTSWSSPLVIPEGGRFQVVVAATGSILAYDLESGNPVWRLAGMSRNVVATPVFGNGMVFAGCSYGHKLLVGIRVEGARGDLTGSDRVAWAQINHAPYVPSPLLYRGRLYVLKHFQGSVGCFEASTGLPVHPPKRIRELYNVYASPVAADGRILIASLAGTTAVLAHDETSEVLAMNRLDDRFTASPVIVEDTVLLRGETSLYCLGETGNPTRRTPQIDP